jgi:hypothetical protein
MPLASSVAAANSNSNFSVSWLAPRRLNLLRQRFIRTKIADGVLSPPHQRASRRFGCAESRGGNCALVRGVAAHRQGLPGARVAFSFAQGMRLLDFLAVEIRQRRRFFDDA